MKRNCKTGTDETTSFEATYVVPQMRATSSREMSAVHREFQIPFPTEINTFFVFVILIQHLETYPFKNILHSTSSLSLSILS